MQVQAMMGNVAASGGADAAGISFVGSTSARTNAADTYNFDISSLSLQQNDLVIVLVAGERSSNINMSATGYTELCDLYANDTEDTNFGVFYKIQGGTPDTSVTVTVMPTTSPAIVIAYALRGVDTTTPIDVTTTTATGSNTNQANPPSITPVTEGAWVLATCGYTQAISTTPTITAPSGYTYLAEEFLSGGGGHVGGCISSKVWSGSGAEDPAAYSGMTNSTSCSRCAATLALRPA